MIQRSDALVTWLGLMTAAELAELAGALDWCAVHLDWSARPRVVGFLHALDALVVGEQRRRLDSATALAGREREHEHEPVGRALATLDRADLQELLRAWRRLARNRDRDASEPVGRFHTAVGDLLARELAARIDARDGRGSDDG